MVYVKKKWNLTVWFFIQDWNLTAAFSCAQVHFLGVNNL